MYFLFLEEEESTLVEFQIFHSSSFPLHSENLWRGSWIPSDFRICGLEASVLVTEFTSMPLIGDGSIQWMFIDWSWDMSFSMKRHLGDRKTLQGRGLKPRFMLNCLALDDSNSLPSSLFLMTKIPLLLQVKVETKDISTYNRNLKISSYEVLVFPSKDWK